MTKEQSSIFTEEQIAKFLEFITDPEERAWKEQWFRDFGQRAAEMNSALPSTLLFEITKEDEGGM